MTDNSGLLFGYLLNGQGGGESMDWDRAKQRKQEQGVLWLHLEYSNAYVQRWLLQESGLDEVSAEALLADETRPRSMLTAGGSFLIFNILLVCLVAFQLWLFKFKKWM